MRHEVSEYCLKPIEQFFSYYGESKLRFDEMIMMPALNQTNTLSWILIVLAH